MNCCLQNILHINLHILYIIHIKTSSKIQELQESNKYIKSFQQNKFELLEKYSRVPANRIIIKNQLEINCLDSYFLIESFFFCPANGPISILTIILRHNVTQCDTMRHNTKQCETNKTTIPCDCNKKGQADDDE